MTFALKPTHSKGTLNRAGQVLVTTGPDTIAYKNALKIVNEWRTCHAYPLNTFNSTLRHKVKRFPDALVAQRLKRLPTIIDKLGRYPDMKLAQMQDIGGIRAVVGSVNPKPDGYRGVHLVFEYNNTLSRNGLAKNYSGLLVELQIRTDLQHHRLGYYR